MRVLSNFIKRLNYLSMTTIYHHTFQLYCDTVLNLAGDYYRSHTVFCES